ncbi:hypothetical protein D6D01_01629 [Aureobasidium pullulans]|uniref:Uncharacterized protein n=1 Tax=Aureobasidium pullulans TaxID=5580 RepID=A0A4S9M028_AURPU|nr:hypothetical protein D6D01_01629 [Aureobasidium pullulans]
MQVYKVYHFAGCWHEEVKNSKGHRVNPQLSRTIGAKRELVETPSICPACSKPGRIPMENIIIRALPVHQIAPFRQNDRDAHFSEETLQKCVTLTTLKLAAYHMGSPKGLRLLAAFEVAELFKKDIFSVVKGVIQVQEAWYAEAMEVASAINNHPMGPSEIMEVTQAVNSFLMGPAKAVASTNAHDHTTPGYNSLPAIHKPKVNMPTGNTTSSADYSTPEYNSLVATHKPKANEPTRNTRSLAAEAFYTNTNMNQNNIFDAVHSRNNTGVFTSSEIADADRDEICTFVIPQLKKVKMTRPEEP